MQVRVAAAVIAGGSSRRMGRDKRGLPVDGVPMLTRVVRTARTVAEHVIVVRGVSTGDPSALADGAEVVVDLRDAAGPLAGVEAALTRLAAADAVLMLAADHPWVQPAVLALLVDTLVDTADADVAVLGGVEPPQPLVAAYRPRAVAAVSAMLDRGERRLTRLLDQVAVATVAQQDWQAVDPQGASMRDVDRPADLRGPA